MRNGKTVLVFMLTIAWAVALLAGAAPPAGRLPAAPAPLPSAMFTLAGDEGGQPPLQPGQGCTTVYATDGPQMLGR